MAPSDPEAAVGQTIAGRYELVQQIARGGMGTVWVATDDKLGRKVALKVMRRESLEAFDDARERFEREARASAALRSGHVVQVHDYGVEDGVPFIAMELLEGESLKDRLAKRGTLGISEAAELLDQVAKGLKAAHQAGLIHRDLKPSNIFITHRDDREVVKLLDFGVVKTVLSRGTEETASGILLGTPQFMSPEQARGLRKIDHRADLWSLGVILYLVLTGDNPFDSDADAVGDIVIRVCIDPIAPPSVINPELSDRMDEFFEQALARDPDDRFQSAEELTEGFMLAAELSFAGLDERSDISGPGGPFGKEPSLSSTPGLGARRSTSAGVGGSDVPPPPEEPPLGELGFASDGDSDADLGRRTSDADLGRRTSDADADDSGAHEVVDESSVSASMSTSVGGVRRPAAARRSPLLVGGIALAALGVAAAAYALMGQEPSRSSGKDAPSLAVSAEAAAAPNDSAAVPTGDAAKPAPVAAPAPEPSAAPEPPTAEPATKPPAVPVTPIPRPTVTPTAEPQRDPPPDDEDGPPTWFPEDDPEP